MQVNIFPIDSLVRITRSSLFRELKDTIRMVEIIAAEVEEPFWVDLATLHGAQIQEPIWVEHTQFEPLASPGVPFSSHASASAVSLPWKGESHAT